MLVRCVTWGFFNVTIWKDTVWLILVCLLNPEFLRRPGLGQQLIIENICLICFRFKPTEFAPKAFVVFFCTFIYCECFSVSSVWIAYLSPVYQDLAEVLQYLCRFTGLMFLGGCLCVKCLSSFLSFTKAEIKVKVVESFCLIISLIVSVLNQE